VLATEPGVARRAAQGGQLHASAQTLLWRPTPQDLQLLSARLVHDDIVTPAGAPFRGEEVARRWICAPRARVS